MTSMQISQGDREAMNAAMMELLLRRRQLAAWPFDRDETELLYIPRNIWDLKAHIRNYDCGKLLYHDNEQQITVLGLLSTAVTVNVQSSSYNLWSGQYLHSNKPNMPVCKAAPHYRDFMSWLAGAIKIEATNQRVYNVWTSVVNTTTTFKQLEKALPVSLQAITAQYAVGDAWQYRKERGKLAAIKVLLETEGARRARTLKEETLELLRPNKSLIEGVLAQCVILPNHCGLLKGSEFDRTWINGMFVT